jgi:hypothetical protein
MLDEKSAIKTSPVETALKKEALGLKNNALHRLPQLQDSVETLKLASS